MWSWWHWWHWWKLSSDGLWRFACGDVFTWRQAELNRTVLVKEERKFHKLHHWNISLSKNCLFLTPLHSNGKGDRLSALLGRHHKVLHQTDWGLKSVIIKYPLDNPVPCCCASRSLCCPLRSHPTCCCASRSHVAAPRNPMLLCLETPGPPRLETPGDKFWDQNFQVSVVFRLLRPKRAIPHPITIQNMRFGQ